MITPIRKNCTINKYEQVELQEYLLQFGPESFIFTSAIHYVPPRRCTVCV